MDEVQKLHLKLKQEQQRWDKECVAREKQQVSIVSMVSGAFTSIWMQKEGKIYQIKGVKYMGETCIVSVIKTKIRGWHVSINPQLMNSLLAT